MEHQTSFDKTTILMIGITLTAVLIGAVALMSSDTFMAAQTVMFEAMAVMAEVCRL